MITYILSWFRSKRETPRTGPRCITIIENCPGVSLIGPYDWPTGGGEAA